MANGYLGKISAVVSANTADFQAKLNASAKDVQAFARTVQSNLTTASKEAARSFESIYTPLQKFERSLQAAASMKLSFKGFAGAIRDVDVLRQRLASMKDSQVSLAVRASGMKNITELREALVGLRAKDLDIVAKVGGIEKVRELRALSAEKRVDFAVNLIDSGLGRRLAEAKARVAELKTEVSSVKAGGAMPSGGVATLAAQYREATAEVTRLQEVGRQTIKATLGVNVQKDADVDRLLQAGERAEAIRLPVILDVLGEAAVRDAVTQTQRIRSVAEQINKPFGEATQKLAGMSVEIQAGFLPAMKRSQAQIESLKSNIEKSVLPAAAIAQQFDVVETRANAAAAAVNRLAEASSKIGSMKTGQELAFSNPRLSETLDRGVAVGNRAAALPATTIQANPRIAEMLGEIATLSNKAVAAYAGLQRRMMLGLPTDSAQKSADALQAKLDALFSEFDATYQIHVDAEQAKKEFTDLTTKAEKLRDQTAFVVTGRPQTLEQTDSRRAALNSEASGLNRSQRQSLKPLLQDADAARVMGDVDKINDALDKLAFKIAQAKKFNVDFDKAKKDSLDLKATMDSLKDESNFVISAQVQNAGQAEAEIKRIVAGMDKLGPAERSFLRPTVDTAIASLATKDIAVISAAVRDLSDEFEQELVLKIRADEAKKSVTSLKESLLSIADSIGDPSQPIDRLRQSVEAANAAIAKMPAGAIRTKLEGDLNSEKIRLEAMAAPGATATAAPDIDAAAARANAIAASAAAATPAKVAANPLGAEFGTAERGIASLQSSVLSLQGNLERLPLPMQSQFVPAINKVRDAFGKLNMSSTQAEIDAVVKKAAGLERVLSRAGQASKLGGTIGEALNEAAITRTEKRLGFVKAKLLEVGAAASGPVANAFNAYSAAAARTAKSGTSVAREKELDRLIAKIGEALVAEGKLTAAQGKAFSKNVGDVGRAGADKFSLALNQAAFAVDDFMSSTGGLEFKLRAVSNNITQLAFILGGTTGLFVGLGAVIAGQAAVGLVKWYNNGRSAEDQTKALNEALARQKSLVEDLAKAFESLGESVSRGTLSASGERTADFDKQMREISKKQRESIRASVSDFDPAVIKERAEQKKLQGKIEKSQDVGEIVGLQVQMEESKRREREASNRAVSAPPPDLDAVQKTVADSFKAMADAMARDALDPEMARENSRPFLDRAARVGRPGDVKDARDTLQATINELSTRIEDGFFTPNQAAQARKQIQELQLALKSLGAPLLRAINAAANEVAEASRGPAEQIRQAQEEVGKAVEAGLPGAREFGAELDKMGNKLSDAYKKLEFAVSGKDAEGRDLSNEDRERLTSEAKAEIDALNARRRDMAAQSEAFRYERTVDPQRQIDARMSRARGNLGAAGLEDGRIARRMREIENERETIRQRSALPEYQSPDMIRRLQNAEQALGREAAAIEAATVAVKIFAETLNRASEEAKGNLNSAQQAADEARRADLGNSTPQTQEARRRAESDLERQRQIERAAQTEIAVERDRLEQQQRPDAERIRQIDEKLASGVDQGDREALIRERDRIRAKMEDDARASQAKIDAARDASTQEEERRKASARGQETARTPEEKFIAETQQGLFEILSYFQRRAEANNGVQPAGDVAAQAAAEKRFREDRAKEARTATSVGRGIELGMTERDRFRRDFREGAGKDINARAEELKAEANSKAEAAREAVRLRADAAGALENSVTAAFAGQDIPKSLVNDGRGVRGRIPLGQGTDKLFGEDYFTGTSSGTIEQVAEAAKQMSEGFSFNDIVKEQMGLMADVTLNYEPGGEGFADADGWAPWKQIESLSGLRLPEKPDPFTDVGWLTKPDEDGLNIKSPLMDDIANINDIPSSIADFEAAKKAESEAQAQAAAARKAQSDFLKQAISNQMEAVAPMLKGFQDERQSAILQGPSRAALNVSDVSTSQGASELTRLIRGDDSAKDVNLEELRKQTDKLDEVVKAIREANPGVLL